MEIKAFLIAFEKQLVYNGYSREAAHEHTLKIAKSLKQSDIDRIHKLQNDHPVMLIADNYTKHFPPKKENRDLSDTVTVSGKFSGTLEKHSDPSQHAYQTSSKTASVGKVSEKEEAEKGTSRTNTKKIEKVRSAIPPKVELTERGKAEYAKWKSSHAVPRFFRMAGTALGIAAVYSLIVLLTVILIAFLISVIVIGSFITLAGLIYGISKMFSVPSEGIYETGLALIVLAATLSLSICIYNLAVRAVPIIRKRFSAYVLKMRIAQRNKLNLIRTECNGV